jgi:catechol 2,3-dioxygenase-like lactoylglutathione lyase family enzyme
MVSLPSSDGLRHYLVTRTGVVPGSWIETRYRLFVNVCIVAMRKSRSCAGSWPRGAKSIYFRDPDGNLAELITPGFWALGRWGSVVG